MVYILASSRVLITHGTFLATSHNYDSRLLPNPNLRKEKKHPLVPLGSWIACCLHLKIELHPCARGRNQSGIFRFH